MGRFLPIDVGPHQVILAGGLVIVDRSCDAFDPVHAEGRPVLLGPFRGADLLMDFFPVFRGPFRSDTLTANADQGKWKFRQR